MKNRVKLTSSFSHFCTGLFCLAGMAGSAWLLYNSPHFYEDYLKTPLKISTVFVSEDFSVQNIEYGEKAQELINLSISNKEKEAELLRIQQEKALAEELAKKQLEEKRKALAAKTKTPVKKPAPVVKPAETKPAPVTVIPDLVPAPLQEPLLLSPTQSQYISEADLMLTDSPSLEFEWEPVPRAQKYYFELFDKNNKLILSKYTTKTQIVLDDELILLSEEGAFSWRITASAIINNKSLSQTSEKQTFIIGLEPIAPIVIDKSNLFVE